MVMPRWKLSLGLSAVLVPLICSLTGPLPLARALPFQNKHSRATHEVKDSSDLKPYRITWLGNAAFQIVSPGGTTVLIDPYLTQDPATPARYKDLKQYHPKAILLTHAHPDHVGDTAAIATVNNAPVIAVFEETEAVGVPKALQLGMNVGGTTQVDDMTIHVVPAMHSSSPGGRPVGFVLTFRDGRSIYDTGDTWIFSDMALIEEIYHPDVILLNTGGGLYTQDPATAALALKKYFSPQAVIPMHYGTTPQQAGAAEVQSAFDDDDRVKIIKPGDTVMF